MQTLSTKLKNVVREYYATLIEGGLTKILTLVFLEDSRGASVSLTMFNQVSLTE